MNKTSLERWSATHSAELYGIQGWSAGYFEISAAGDLLVRPRGAGSDTAISVPEIVAGLEDRGLPLPVLLRFGDILDDRIALLNDTFRRAMQEAGYQGDYRGVYPVKVNQQQQVIEEVTDFGRSYHHGLEVGSKAELIAAVSYLHDPEALLICNGYKDAEFIELALHARRLGLRPVLVIEMLSEVPEILAVAERLGVEPLLGLRVKLASRAGGMWTESGGDRSFFGLNAADTIVVIDRLREAGKLDCLQLLHYHVGSQIPNIRDLRTAIHEAARIYVDLVREGAPLGILDVGGGLAVDYDGSHTNFHSSSNYTVEEYCADIVEGVMTTLDPAGIPHPTLVSESGRALVSHHSVLLFSVLESSSVAGSDPVEEPPADAPEMVHNLWDIGRSLTLKNAQEAFHDATYYRDELRALFVHGNLPLRERARAEQIFWNLAARIAELTRNQKYVPDELRDMSAAIADVYYANVSVFQSLPDSWAIGQLFPIMPIQRLQEEPTREAIIADITCDCDGKIDKFIDLHDIRRTLSLHPLNGEPYVLAVFLVGAYQETLGDLHNLLGDTNVVSVRLDEEGRLDLSHEIVGDTVEEVLTYVEYDPKAMIARIRRLAERGVRDGRVSPGERRRITDAFETGLRGYTYFEP